MKEKANREVIHKDKAGNRGKLKKERSIQDERYFCRNF